MNYISKKQKHFKSIIPGVEIGAHVVKASHDSKADVSFAIRKWKKGLKDSGKLEALKDRQEFLAPSEKKRRAKEKGLFLAQRNTERNA